MAKKAAPAPKKPLTKTQLLSNISESTGVPKKDVSAVMDALSEEIGKAMGRSGAGAISIPGIVKIEKKKVPAKPARKGVPNPFRPGELMDVAAKPASTKVKVRPLKMLKDMA